MSKFIKFLRILRVFLFLGPFLGLFALPWGNPNFYYQIILAQGLDSNLCRRNPRQPEQQCQAVAGGGVDLQRGKVSPQKIPQQVRDCFRCQVQIQNSPKTRICVKFKFQLPKSHTTNFRRNICQIFIFSAIWRTAILSHNPVLCISTSKQVLCTPFAGRNKKSCVTNKC